MQSSHHMSQSLQLAFGQPIWESKYCSAAMTKTMESKWFPGILAVAWLMGSGCSSINGREESRFYPGVYPGLRYHAADYTAGTEGSEPLRSGYDDPVHEKEKTERRIAALIDWPFSFVLDTALLPWDALYWALKTDSK